MRLRAGAARLSWLAHFCAVGGLFACSILSDGGNRRVGGSGGKNKNRRLRPVFSPHHLPHLPFGERPCCRALTYACMYVRRLFMVARLQQMRVLIALHNPGGLRWGKAGVLSRLRVLGSTIVTDSNLRAFAFRGYDFSRWCTGLGASEGGRALTGVRTRPQQRSTSCAGQNLGRSCWGAGRQTSPEPGLCT